MDYVLETFWKRLKDILKTCYQEQINLMIRLEKILKTSWRCLKTSSKCLEDVLKTFWRSLENVLTRRLEDILKTSWRLLENVLKTSWRRMTKTNILVLIKTSSEDVYVRWIIWRLLKTKTKDVFKTSSSRRMFAGNCVDKILTFGF